MNNQFFLVIYDTNFNLVITEHATLEAAKAASGNEPKPAMIVVFDWFEIDLKVWPVAYRNIQRGKRAAQNEWTNITYTGERAKVE